MEKSGLSQQILNYYYKFGQNRDLEKYLRLRRNCYKSSSEGSVNTLEYHDNHSKNLASSKSLDDLTFRKSQRDKKQFVAVDPVRKKQVKVKISTKDTSEEFGQSKTTKPIKTDNNSVKKKDNDPKSSYSVSCESNISINLPLSIIDNSSSNNKLDNQPVTSADNSNHDEAKLDESNCSSNDNELLKSPSTSAKMEKRLEWDSLGDVGYNKSLGQRRRKSTITSLEKSILKEFFANQGIEINFPVHREEKGIIAGQNKSKVEKPQQGTNAARERWREVLHNVKEKYKEESAVKINLQSNQNSFVQTIPNTHSTPKEKTSEKCSQTSFIHPSENKEVQVNITKKDSSTLSSSEGDSAVSPSSFEFVAPRQMKYSESSDKENHDPSQSSVGRSNKSKNNQHSNTDSGESQSTSGVNLGVKLLCSLIEAKSLNHKQKKLLAKKIIAKITKKNIVSSNENTLSSMSPISTSSRSANKGANSSSMQTLKTASSSSMKNTGNKNEECINKNLLVNNGTNEVLKSTKSDDGEDIKKTSSSIAEIEKEITGKKSSLSPKSVPEYDKNNLLKNWLGNVTKSEIQYAQRKKAGKQRNMEIDTNAGGDSLTVNHKSPRIIEYLELERMNHVNWIENEIKHLENLKRLLTKDKALLGENNTSLQPQITIAYPVHKNLDSNMYDKVSSTNRSKDKNPTTVIAADRVVELKKMESEVEIRNDKEKYIRKVKKTTDEILYEKVDALTNGDAEKAGNHLKIITYTVDEEKRFPKKDYKIVKSAVGDKAKKYSRSKLETPHSSVEEKNSQFEHQSSESNHYSELRSVDGSRKKYKADAEVQYTTSGSHSNFSSVSISLPMVQSSLATTTTTHRYDRHVSIGIQTTGSLRRSDPIFGPPNIHPTIREYRSNKNKQTQVKPVAVAYIINFEKDKQSKLNESNDSNKYSCTLRECLQRKRPDFSQRVCERQRILDELKCLRKERQKKIEKILENASESSVSQKLNLLPPPPTKYIRIFGTREMKEMTKRRYRELPEVLAKKETESRERKKRNSRILASVFNKRLQGRVRCGKLSLEHSRTVI